MFLMPNYFIVALSGKAHSGKTTVANELAEAYGWNHVSLAAQLKREVRERFNLSVEQTDGYFKNSPTQYRRQPVTARYETGDESILEGPFYTPRDIMIKWGFASRDIDPDYWLKQLRLRSDFINVVSDMRFENELRWFKERGAVVVRLERAQELRKFTSVDPSETELDDAQFDLVIPEHENVLMDDVPAVARRIYDHVINSYVVH